MNLRENQHFPDRCRPSFRPPSPPHPASARGQMRRPTTDSGQPTPYRSRHMMTSRPAHAEAADVAARGGGEHDESGESAEFARRVAVILSVTRRQYGLPAQPAPEDDADPSL